MINIILAFYLERIEHSSIINELKSLSNMITRLVDALEFHNANDLFNSSVIDRQASEIDRTRLTTPREGDTCVWFGKSMRANIISMINI